MELPSFEQYKRLRDNWLHGPEMNLGLVDQGSHYLKHLVKKHEYEICGYRCKTLEEVEKIAKNQGIPLQQLDFRPMIIPQSGLKCDILIKFMPREEIQRRENW